MSIILVLLVFSSMRFYFFSLISSRHALTTCALIMHSSAPTMCMLFRLVAWYFSSSSSSSGVRWLQRFFMSQYVIMSPPSLFSFSSRFSSCVSVSAHGQRFRSQCSLHFFHIAYNLLWFLRARNSGHPGPVIIFLAISCRNNAVFNCKALILCKVKSGVIFANFVNMPALITIGI